MEKNNFISTTSKPNVDSSSPTASTSPTLPAAYCEYLESIFAAMFSNCDTEESNISNSVKPAEKSYPNGVLEDNKDEMIRKLFSRVVGCYNEFREANQKFMQATQVLSENEAKLEALRREEEEVERVEKEKQTLEENLTRKLSKMEKALRKSRRRLAKRKAVLDGYVSKNTALRLEKEVVKSHIADIDASLEEESKRVEEIRIQIKSRKQLIAKYSEKLAAKKRKFLNLKQEVDQAEIIRKELEATWNLEVKKKEELQLQASQLRKERKEREEKEATLKYVERMEMKLKGENCLRKHKNNIRKLEMKISKLRLKMDTKESAERDESTDLEEDSDNESTKRDVLCLMCSIEETTVVFLPCAHLVVCTKCNELLEKQGNEKCPSCERPIKERVCARFPAS